MRYLIIGFLALMLSGCFTTKPNPILTSRDESWLIPVGVEFQAVKKDGEPLKTYRSEDWLMVLYRGSYLEVERRANACSR